MKRYILLVCAMLMLASYTTYAGPPISGGGGSGAGDFLADGTVPMTAAPVPNAANTIALGSNAAEWADLFLGDGAIIYGQNDSSATLTSSASKWTANNFGVTTALTLPATLSSAAAVTWTLMDNQASGISFGATGAADILKVGTLDAGAGVTIGGFLTSTGTVTAAAFSTTRNATASQSLTLYEDTDLGDDYITLTATGGDGASDNATWSSSAGIDNMSFGSLHLIMEGVTSTGATGTGPLVFGVSPTFTTSVALPQGANPTVDAAGEIAVDTTTDQLAYYGGAKRVLPYKHFVSVVIGAPAATDDVNLLKAPYGMTIIAINCIVQGTTSVTGQLQECDSAGANCADLDSDIVCDADGAADDGSLTDSAIASAGWLRWKTTSVVDTPTFLTVTATYSVVAD